MVRSWRSEHCCATLLEILIHLSFFRRKGFYLEASGFCPSQLVLKTTHISWSLKVTSKISSCTNSFCITKGGMVFLSTCEPCSKTKLNVHAQERAWRKYYLRSVCMCCLWYVLQMPWGMFVFLDPIPTFGRNAESQQNWLHCTQAWMEYSKGEFCGIYFIFTMAQRSTNQSQFKIAAAEQCKTVLLEHGSLTYCSPNSPGAYMYWVTAD